MIDNKEKRKRGGQPRYPGEEQQRLSITVRPRYKKALEILAQQRRTSVSEAAEFAIAYTASKHAVNGTAVLNYVRPPEESFDRYRHALALDAWNLSEADWEAREKDLQEKVEQLAQALIPFPGGFEEWMLQVLEGVPVTSRPLWHWFHWGILINAANEDYREGKLPEEAASLIVAAAGGIDR